MKDWIRTKYCGELRKSDAGSTVILNGWVNRRRDLGQLIFVDLRDRSGLVQVVFDPETLGPEQFQQAEGLRSEYVIAVQGQVVARPEGQVNPNLATGEVEVLVSSLVVLAEAKTPPSPLIGRRKWMSRCALSTAICICAAESCRKLWPCATASPLPCARS